MKNVYSPKSYVKQFNTIEFFLDIYDGEVFLLVTKSQTGLRGKDFQSTISLQAPIAQFNDVYEKAEKLLSRATSNKQNIRRGVKITDNLFEVFQVYNRFHAPVGEGWTIDMDKNALFVLGNGPIPSFIDNF